jgi:hypothetical protein
LADLLGLLLGGLDNALSLFERDRGAVFPCHSGASFFFAVSSNYMSSERSVADRVSKIQSGEGVVQDLEQLTRGQMPSIICAPFCL